MAKPTQVLSLRFVTEMPSNYTVIRYWHYNDGNSYWDPVPTCPYTDMTEYTMTANNNSTETYSWKLPSVSSGRTVRKYTWDHTGLGTDYHAVNVYIKPFDGVLWHNNNDFLYVWSENYSTTKGYEGLRLNIYVTTVRNVAGDWYTVDCESDPVELIDHVPTSKMSPILTKLPLGLQVDFYSGGQTYGTVGNRASVVSSGIYNPADLSEQITDSSAVLTPPNDVLILSSKYRNKVFINDTGNKYDYYEVKYPGSDPYIGIDLGENSKANLNSVYIDHSANIDGTSNTQWPTAMIVQKSQDGVAWENVSSTTSMVGLYTSMSAYSSEPARFYRVIASGHTSAWRIKRARFNVTYVDRTHQNIVKADIYNETTNSMLISLNATNNSVVIPESFLATSFSMYAKTYNGDYGTQSHSISVGYAKPPRPTSLAKSTKNIGIFDTPNFVNKPSLTVMCQANSNNGIMVSLDGLTFRTTDAAKTYYKCQIQQEGALYDAGKSYLTMFSTPYWEGQNIGGYLDSNRTSQVHSTTSGEIIVAGWSSLKENTWYNIRAVAYSDKRRSDAARIQLRTKPGSPVIYAQSGNEGFFSLKADLTTITKTPDVKHGVSLTTNYTPGTTVNIQQAPFITPYDLDDQEYLITSDTVGENSGFIKRPDGNFSNYFEVQKSGDEIFVGYEFKSAVQITKIYISSEAMTKTINTTLPAISEVSKPVSGKLQRSDDGINWTDASEEFDIPPILNVSFTPDAKAKFWRVLATDFVGGTIIDNWNVVYAEFNYVSTDYEMNTAKAYDGNTLKKTYTVSNGAISVPIADLAMFPNGIAIELYDNYGVSSKSNVIKLDMPTNLKAVETKTTEATLAWEYKTATEKFKLYIDSLGGVEITPGGDFLTDDQRYLKIKAPVSVATDSDRNLYVFSGYNGQVYIYDRAGKLIRTFGGYGTSSSMFHTVKKIIVDDEQRIYVLDSGANAVKKFNFNGTFIKSIGGRGSEDSQFNNPSHIAIYEGNLYVTDTGNKKLKIFDSNGDLIKAMTLTYYERKDISFGYFLPGDTFGAAGRNNLMSVLSAEGFEPAYRASYGIWDFDSRWNTSPWSGYSTRGYHVAEVALKSTDSASPKMVIKYENNIAVISEPGYPQIKPVSVATVDPLPNGKANVSVLSGSGSVIKYLQSEVATDIAVGPLGKLASCSFNYNKVGLGLYPTTPLSPTWNMAQFNNPKGVAFDEVGNLYVADFGNDLVKCFNDKGQLISVFGGDETALLEGNSIYSYKNIGLTPGTEYTFKLSGIVDGIETGVSSPLTITTKFEPVSVPDIDPSDVTTTTATINWNDPNGSNILGYKFYLDSSPTPIGTKLKDGIEEYTIEGLEPNKKYKVSMTAYTDTSESEISNQSEITTKPVPPTGIKITRLKSDTARITWDMQQDIVEYTIKVGATEYTTVANTIDISGLAIDVDYAVEVKSKNITGYSVYSEPATFNLTAVQTAPILVVLDESSDTELRLTWGDIADLDHYEVWLDGVSIITNLASNGYTITGLTPARVYLVVIKAQDSFGTWFESAPLNCKTYSSGVFNADLGDVPDPVTDEEIAIKWDAVVGAVKYKVHANSQLIYEVNNFDSLLHLDAGKKYVVEVQAIGASDEILNSDILVASTHLKAPSGLFTIPSEITSTTAVLRWSYDGGEDALTGFILKIDGVIYDEFEKGSEQKFDISELTPSTTYVVTLIAKGTDVPNSPESASITITTSA